ncbi:hypothetical protein PUNSTDRAFT_52198, partial [Punctularia strigosozonata HHB-11173 SS5]|uniref:uncharacterized protein n=1 Tax=Punctularia strigosozonata (strain HHB-11173) TaxID=741275 RepID=UPI0004417637
RAIQQPPKASKHANELPPLTPEASRALKIVQNDLVRMLAEKRIDIPLYGSAMGKQPTPVKEQNEQNVKNRAREQRFNAEIDAMKAEDQAWAKAAEFYNSYQASVLAELETKKLQKAKAKADPGADDVDDRLLPPTFRGPGGVQLARAVLADEIPRRNKLAERVSALPFEIDRMHASVSAARLYTHAVESHLDSYFASLSLATHSSTSASTSRPPRLNPAPRPLSEPPAAKLDEPRSPRDLLRALARVDVERPPTKVSEAARKAMREVQRAAKERADVMHTPRKPPPTPRRDRTPGRERTPGRR